MDKLHLFDNVSDKELINIYNDIQECAKDGIRPRSIDKYSDVVMRHFPMSRGEAWRYVEQVFFEAVAARYFDRMKG